MEEITTIFVVGFPDDMNEREFQNMFIFNPGFEAATLKIPTPNKDGRKQIIGFAKFHTKMDALNAMEVLTGRQIDFEKGSILKAEMAKKNLHTKKTMMNMYYPTSSMKNSCMQYHNMMPDNVNNCMNFNNNNMANNLCNQLLKDDSNIYQLNNLNRGMNLPANTGISPLVNNGLIMPGARERNGNMNILNSANQPFMDQNSSLFNGNRNMYKLPNYQSLDMNHSTAMNANAKPGFDKLYKNIPGTTNGANNLTNNNNNSLLYNNNIFNFLAENPNAPKELKQQHSLPNNIFSFSNSLQKPMQQPNTFSSNPNFMNGVYRQPSSLLDNDFSVNNNHATGTSAVGTATSTTNKFTQNSGNLNLVDSPFSSDLYNNSFNLSLNYFGGNNDILKSRTSLHENAKEGSPMDDLKKLGPLSTSSTTPLFFSPISNNAGFMDLNNNGSNVDTIGNKSGMMDPTNDLNNKFYNLSLNMAMDKSTTKNGKENEIFDGASKDDQKKSEKSKEELEFSNTNDFINGAGSNSILKNNFTFNLFSNENSTSILDSLGKNDSYGLVSKLSSSSMNLPYKNGNFDKINSLNEKDVDLSIQSNEESSSTISSNNTITNAKSNNSLNNNGSDFTLNEGNADNTTEPESSILSSLTNLTSEPIIPPPQVYSSNVPPLATEGN